MGIPRRPDARGDGIRNLPDISLDELIEGYGVKREQVQAVLQFAAHSTEAPSRKRLPVAGNRQKRVLNSFGDRGRGPCCRLRRD
jgi:hypothetical protein